MSSDEVVFAYVGSVMPDEPRYVTEAYSRAGVLFQRNLLRALDQDGIQPSLILSYVQRPSFPRDSVLVQQSEATELWPGADVRLMPFLNITPLKQLGLGMMTFGNLLRWCWQYRSRANRVIYVFNLTSPLGVLSWAAGRLGGAQLVVSLNDINEPGETVPDSLRFRLDFWLQKRLIPHFDGHVVVADAIAEDFLPGRPYVRVEGGVDELTEEDQAPSVAPETFSMVLAGTLNEANGVGLLLDALKILNDAALRVRIAGQGPMLDAVRQAARDDSRIEYVGFLGLGEVRELYRRSDLLLNLRLTRAVRTRYFFPSKVIEFLASGTPLLTTCPGHVRSEFSDLAFLLEEETPEALASLLRKVMTTTSEERLRQAKLAREQIFASHSWLAHGRRVASYIRGVVAQGRR